MPWWSFCPEREAKSEEKIQGEGDRERLAIMVLWLFEHRFDRGNVKCGHEIQSNYLISTQLNKALDAYKHKLRKRRREKRRTHNKSTLLSRYSGGSEMNANKWNEKLTYSLRSKSSIKVALVTAKHQQFCLNLNRITIFPFLVCAKSWRFFLQSIYCSVAVYLIEKIGDQRDAICDYNIDLRTKWKGKNTHTQSIYGKWIRNSNHIRCTPSFHRK